jgi:hypothetical protein
MAALRILILGGYGTFGGRLARLLADDQRAGLIIAGRSRDKAETFCAVLGATAVPAALDRGGDVERRLQELAPDLVVDASGPFQCYGEDPYRVVRAALACGIHYLDLADGSDFVDGITQFDVEARARNVFVLAGVSSFPLLTAAAVRELARDMARVESVTAGIAPSPHANVGVNVIRAIASYAGRPVALLRDGRKAVGYALIDALRYTIAPPGRLPLDRRRFTLVDAPDLKVLPRLWPMLRSVWTGAAPVPALWHRALNALAWLVRLRLLPSLSPLAPLMQRVMHVLTFGEHRGGMFVAIEGVCASGAPVARSWHLLAEGDDGPLIPAMAAAAVIRRCLSGRPPAPGARAAIADLELEDYLPLFARRAIHTGKRHVQPSCERAPLYRRLLGDAWDALPPPLQAMHAIDRGLVAHGIGDVERGRGWSARLAAWLIGFPPAGRGIPVKVEFEARDGCELWRRQFAGRSFSSIQEEGRGRFERLLCERFGSLKFGMALVLDDDRLRLVVRRRSAFGIALPRVLAPRGDFHEFARDGRFHFHVEIRHPFGGLIVAYRGWLAPQSQASWTR